MNQDERYVITLTPEQEIITEQALELLARLHIGQFERIAELLCDPRDQDYCQRRDLGRYDGTNYGIAFTQDGGDTWQNALDFSGVHISSGEIDQITISDDAPENPAIDAVWLDTSGVPNIFYRWNGTSWVDCGQEVNIDTELSQLKSEMQNYVDTNAASAGDLASFEQTVGTILDIDENGETTLIQRIYQAIDASGDAAASQYKEILKYIRFVNGSIVLGEQGNEITLTIVNDRISFTQNGTEVAYISDNTLYIGNAIVRRGGILQLGNFGFVPEEDGSLSFLKIGGE